MKVKLTAFVMLIFMCCVACKKEQSDPDPEENTGTQIVAQELDDYYIVSEDRQRMDATQGLLTIFYFVLSGENVNVTRDAPGQNRLIQRIKLNGNEFRFETNKLTYSFELSKEGGDLQLTDYSFKNYDNQQADIIYAQIYKRSEVPDFLDKTFVDMDSPQSYLLVTRGGKYKWHESPNFGNMTNSYFNLRNFGWKASHSDYYGVMVKSWKSYDSPVMLMHSDLGNVMRIFEEL